MKFLKNLFKSSGEKIEKQVEVPPTVLEEDIGKYFSIDEPSPYMLLVIPVKEDIRKPEPEGYDEMELYDRLYHVRSDVPAITHIDYSARIQSVHKEALSFKDGAVDKNE